MCDLCHARVWLRGTLLPLSVAFAISSECRSVCVALVIAGAGRRCTYAVCTYLLTYLLTMETTSLGTHLETSFIYLSIYLRQRGAPRGVGRDAVVTGLGWALDGSRPRAAPRARWHARPAIHSPAGSSGSTGGGNQQWPLHTARGVWVPSRGGQHAAWCRRERGRLQTWTGGGGAKRTGRAAMRGAAAPSPRDARRAATPSCGARAERRAAALRGRLLLLLLLRAGGDRGDQAVSTGAPEGARRRVRPRRRRSPRCGRRAGLGAGGTPGSAATAAACSLHTELLGGQSPGQQPPGQQPPAGRCRSKGRCGRASRRRRPQWAQACGGRRRELFSPSSSHYHHRRRRHHHHHHHHHHHYPPAAT